LKTGTDKPGTFCSYEWAGFFAAFQSSCARAIGVALTKNSKVTDGLG